MKSYFPKNVQVNAYNYHNNEPPVLDDLTASGIDYVVTVLTAATQMFSEQRGYSNLAASVVQHRKAKWSIPAYHAYLLTCAKFSLIRHDWPRFLDITSAAYYWKLLDLMPQPTVSEWGALQLPTTREILTSFPEQLEPTPAALSAAFNISEKTASQMLTRLQSIELPDFVFPKGNRYMMSHASEPQTLDWKNFMLSIAAPMILSNDELGNRVKGPVVYSYRTTELHAIVKERTFEAYKKSYLSTNPFVVYKRLHRALASPIPFFPYYLTALVDFCRLLEASYGQGLQVHLQRRALSV